MVAQGDAEKVYHGPGYITERLGRFNFLISANSFFQTNTLQAERLYDVVKDLAQLKPGDIVYDLYSGTGTIPIYLSELSAHSIGIEMNESAIMDARRNVELNGITNCFFLRGDLADGLSSLRAAPSENTEFFMNHPAPTVVIADPPRNGMHPKVVVETAKLAPDRIVYVSCNPSTQARDARMFAEAGYELAVVQPVDMFPHTDHVEAVALFRRR